MTTDLPPNWTIARLDELGQWGSGGTPKRSVYGYFGGPIPWLKIGDLPDGPVTTSEETITQAGLDHSSAKLIPPGTLMVAMYGSVGKLGITTMECATNQAIAFCRVDERVVTTRYLFWLLRHMRPDLVSAGKGDTQLNISQEVLRPLRVPLAPLNQQQRIVEEMEKQFTRLEAAEAALRSARIGLRRYRAALIGSGVMGRFAPQPAQGSRSTGLLPSLRDVPLPGGWRWTTVRDTGEVQLGRQRAPQHHHGPYMRPYLRVANVFDDRLDLSDILEMNFSPAEFERFALRSGDILLNEGQSRELVGRAAMYREEMPGSCFQNTLIRFRAGRQVIPEFALLVFRAYFYSGHFSNLSRWTTSIAHLGADRFASMPFPLPPREEQSVIVTEIEQRLSLVRAAEGVVDANLRRAARLRQSILKHAFEGKLFARDPDEEPAPVLPEHARADRLVTALLKVPTTRKRPIQVPLFEAAEEQTA